MESPTKKPIEAANVSVTPRDEPPPTAPARGALRRVAGILISDPISWRGGVEVIEEEGAWGKRVMQGVFYRVALLPLFAILFAAGAVYLKTHPKQASYMSDPMSRGVFYQPVVMMSDDHVRLDGWLAPALDAEQVIDQGLEALRTKSPAVVLAHGFGMSPRQVLDLFRPLHDKGYVVLAISMRGAGSATPAGETLGLNEAMDIKAGVDLLRKRVYVDAKRIAVVGIGSGANAAILAADKDPTLAALVLDAPTETGAQAFAQHVEFKHSALTFLNPVCKLAFELAYGVETRDLDLSRYGPVLAARPTLLMRWSNDAQGSLPQERVDQIVEFISKAIDKPAPEADGKDPADNDR